MAEFSALRDERLLTGAGDNEDAAVVPVGSAANRNFCSSLVSLPTGADPVLVDLVFDAQTSGGLVLSVPEAQLAQARDMLLAAGDLAVHIGQVLPSDLSGAAEHHLTGASAPAVPMPVCPFHTPDGICTDRVNAPNS